MYLQPEDVGVVRELGYMWYVSAAIVMAVCFGIAIKLMGNYDGE
jgi:hypothetical protein